MAYNMFPATYQQYYPQQYQQQYQQPTMQSSNNQQMMTPPTIHAEIIQVNDRNEGANFPVGTGQTQMMMTKDDSLIMIKSVLANGQTTIVEYPRKPVETLSKNESNYVTRDEFEKRISEIISTIPTTQKEEVISDEQSI